MANKQTLISLVEEHFEGTDKFLVDVIIKNDEKIMVFIDGDHGITIDDCSRLSRFLESRLDRDKEDFELNVSSHGADQPLKFRRQYVKNIGRSLRVTCHDGSQVTGKILTVGDDILTLLVESGKGKKTVSEVSLQFDEIKEAKVVLSFK